MSQAKPFMVGAAIDWRPLGSEATGERWHGRVVGPVECGRIPVVWEVTDCSRLQGGRGEKPLLLPLEERALVSELAACDPHGPHHPRSLEGGDLVDWAPRGPGRGRKHGRVETVVPNAPKALVNWMLVQDGSGPIRDVDPALPEIELVHLGELRPCEEQGELHPHESPGTAGLIYLEVKAEEPRTNPGWLDVFRIDLGLLGSLSNTGRLVKLNDDGSQTGGEPASMNAVLHSGDYPIAQRDYALTGTDNAWTNFRCAGCDRYIQATHQWLYDHGRYPGLRPLRAGVLDEVFKLPKVPASRPPTLEGATCWLGRPCDSIMGPFAAD